MRHLMWIYFIVKNVMIGNIALPIKLSQRIANFEQQEYHYDLLNCQTYVRTLDGKEQENFYDGKS